MLGDPRSNQNPALLSFGILLFKWHNVIAERVQLDNPDWSDEEVFQKARRFVVATLQVIRSSLSTPIGISSIRRVKLTLQQFIAIN